MVSWSCREYAAVNTVLRAWLGQACSSFEQNMLSSMLCVEVPDYHYRLSVQNTLLFTTRYALEKNLLISTYSYYCWLNGMKELRTLNAFCSTTFPLWCFWLLTWAEIELFAASGKEPAWQKTFSQSIVSPSPLKSFSRSIKAFPVLHRGCWQWHW